MKKIIFRADGNSETGLGHLYRIFALIEMFKNNYEYELLTRENSTLSVIPPTYNYKIIPDAVPLKDEPQWLKANYPSANHILIADGYQFSSLYQKEIKKLEYKLMYVDDLVTEYMYADIIVNHSPAVKVSDYKSETYTRFALGTSYAILRPQFLEAAKHQRLIAKMDTAFVCFGGADELDLTTKATKALLSLKEIVKINCVIGAAFKHKEIFDLQKKHPQLKVYQNISEKELVRVMKECQFAIAPSSTILYEICAVKMPVLSGYFVENQKGIYGGCLARHLIFEGGNFENYGVEDFKNKIKTILSETNYQSWMDAQSKLFDSQIKERFLQLLLTTTYRKAGTDDMMQVFTWANDKLARANSYFTDPITLETHKNWFEKKLRDPKSIIYIAEIENKPAGMIRYEVEGENAVVGILVGEEFRGKGLASSFLKDTAKLYFSENPEPVLAYIKTENSASARSFEKANYKKIREEVIHGSNSFVYKLEE